MEYSIVDTVNRIRETRNALKQSMESYKAAILPCMADYSCLRDVYALYEEKKGTKSSETYNVMQYLFVAVFLFCPSKLLGGKMSKGLRRELSRITGCPDARISVMSNDILLYYSTYKDFKEAVDSLLAAVVANLHSKE